MKKNIILLALIIIPISGNAQQRFNPGPIKQNQQTGISLLSQFDDLHDLYLKAVRSGNEFIYGKEYFQYHFRSNNKPILRQSEDRTASLVFNGEEYKKIVLQYDTFTDEVIYTYDELVYKDKIYQIALNRDYISGFNLYFEFDTMSFRYFNKEQDTTFNLQDGFYEVVYEGKCSFLVKHVSLKYRYEGIDEFEYKPVRYIKTGDKYSKVSSKKQFLTLFGSRSEEIRRFIRVQKIWFRRADKRQVTEILRYYESLNSSIE